MRIAIMQPYFLPYAGYFRLLRDVDAFVVYDTVQFPRGGWVHRNRLRGRHGASAWLTLPLAHAPLGTRIRDIGFHEHAQELWRKRIRAFPACSEPRGDAVPLAQDIAQLHGSPLDVISRSLRAAALLLGFEVPFVMASSLAIPGPLDRLGSLIAICRAFGATEYLNAPGGRQLYDAQSFARHGIALQFLPVYRGPADSVLQRLHDEPAQALRREIDANMT